MIDETTAEKIVAGVRRGLPWQSAAVLAGIHERDYREWQARAAKGEEPFVRLFDRVTLAETELEAECVAIVLRAAHGGDRQAADWLGSNVRRRRLARTRVPNNGEH